MRDAELLNIFTRRSFLIATGEVLLFIALVARLWQLQIRQGDKFGRLSDKNSIRVKLLPPPRGNILDRDDRLLVGNRNVYDVMMIPEEMISRGFTVDEVLTRIGSIVDLSQKDKDRIYADIKRKRAFFPVMVKGGLSWAEMSKIQVENLSLPGVYVEERAMRHYPYSEAGAHVVGYVAAVEERDLREDKDPLLNMPGFKIGRAGMEKVKDMSLRGGSGEEVQLVNAVGRVVEDMPDKKRAPVPGANLRLTVDSRLQKYASDRITGDRAATAVVMDVFSGDVLAMVSTPSFDPNIFLDEDKTVEEFNNLIKNPHKPFLNKSIEGLYSPGSTFKMMTALAALEKGIINPSTRFFCPGFFENNKQKYWCWRPKGHGLVDFDHSLAFSCDVYYYNIASQIDMDDVQDMAHRFGLGQSTGIELPNERAGQVPSRRWKSNYRAERWYVGDMINAAIGQGFTLVSPLQLCVMVARIANGGYAVEPRVIKGEHENKIAPKITVNETHLGMIRRGMFRTVNDEGGTGQTARFVLNGARMSGKTGTTQVRSLSASEHADGRIAQSDLPWHLRNHALFVGYAPSDNPRYAVAVLVEHGASGSGAAAPLARDIMKKTLELGVGA